MTLPRPSPPFAPDATPEEIALIRRMCERICQIAPQAAENMQTRRVHGLTVPIECDDQLDRDVREFFERKGY